MVEYSGGEPQALLDTYPYAGVTSKSAEPSPALRPVSSLFKFMATAAYNFADHVELALLADQFNNDLSHDRQAEIRSWVQHNTICTNLQVPPYNPELADTMTLGELAQIGINDPGTQMVDVKSIKNLAYGDQGIIKPKKSPGDGFTHYRMLEPLGITYLADPDGGDPTHPANSSGRHRNYFLQMLLHAAGVDWDDAKNVKIYVTRKVARSHAEFSGCMLVANSGPSGPRKQSALERNGYTLSSRGVNISSSAGIIRTYQGFAKVNDYPDLFGMLVAMLKEENDPATKATTLQDVFDTAKRAYGFVYRLNTENRNAIKRIFVTDAPAVLETAKQLAESYGEIEAEIAGTPSPLPTKTRIAQRFADQLAEIWEVAAKEHQNEVEVAKAKINALQSSITLLEENFVS
jgi:hypothetical protein